MAKRIGEILLEHGSLNQEQLDTALGRQRRFGGRLASNVLALGFLDERALAQALSLQLGVPFAVLSRSGVALELIGNIPIEVARRLLALPVHKEGRELFVAFADPKAFSTVDEIRFITGSRVVEHGALIGPLHDTIEEAYRLREYGSAKYLEGVDLDTSIALDAAGGHVEIVVGSRQGPPRVSVEPLMPAEAPVIEGGDSWVDRLASELPPAPAKSEKTTLLVVDDEPELLHMLVQFLEKSGFRALAAADGNLALKSLQAELPDIILLDAMLPGVHGFDICFRVKHAEATRHIPVIMISAVYRGWRYADDVRRLYGADAFLEKPLRLDQLKHVIDSCMKNKGVPTPAEEISARSNAALQLAANSFRQGDIAASARHLEEAIAASPFVASLHHRLGLLYDRLNDLYRAIAELERAVELQPTFRHVFELAQVYEKAGFTHKAYEAWERCLRLCEDKEKAEQIRLHMQKLLP